MKSLRIDRALLLQLRQARAWSDTQLAHAAGVELTTVLRAGRREPIDATTIARLAHALGVRAEELIEQRDPTKSMLVFLPHVSPDGPLDDLVRCERRWWLHDDTTDAADDEVLQPFRDRLEDVWITWSESSEPERVSERAVLRAAVVTLEAAGFRVFCAVRELAREAPTDDADRQDVAHIALSRPGAPNVVEHPAGSAGLFAFFPRSRREPDRANE